VNRHMPATPAWGNQLRIKDANEVPAISRTWPGRSSVYRGMIASRSCTWKRGVACCRRWLLSCGYEVEEVAEILSFSPRWVRALLKRYNEGGAEALGDQRIHNGTKPTIPRPVSACIQA
jgi:hypothetical protein